MTIADMHTFGDALKRTGRILSAKPVTDELVEDYFHDLAAFAVEDVIAALDRCRSTCRYLPKPVQIREAMTSTAPTSQVPDWVDSTAGRFYCRECDDSGFVRGLECPGDGTCHIGACGHAMGYVHTYTRRCGCRATNPVLAAERAAILRRQATAVSQ